MYRLCGRTVGGRKTVTFPFHLNRNERPFTCAKNPETEQNGAQRRASDVRCGRLSWSELPRTRHLKSLSKPKGRVFWLSDCIWRRSGSIGTQARSIINSQLRSQPSCNRRTHSKSKRGSSTLSQKTLRRPWQCKTIDSTRQVNELAFKFLTHQQTIPNY